MTAAIPTNVVAPHRSVLKRILQVVEYRELLGNMIRKELDVRYSNSSLGFFWSLLNPMMYLVVFYVVFELVLGAGIPYFAIFLLTGLLAWNFFATSLGAATGAVTGNASLVNKVWFPREILPLAAVGANLVHFFLQALVLFAALAAFRLEIDWGYAWLIFPAVLALVLLTCALAVFLACANVYARDTQHLLELVLLGWFWMTPIVYAWFLPAGKLAEQGLPAALTLINPMTSIVLALQRGLYGIAVTDGGVQQLPVESALWYLRNLGIVAAVSLVLLVLAMRLFGRLEASFAEEL